MSQVRKVKTFKGTWLGRPGTQVTHHFDSQPMGLRVIVQKWDDSQEITVRLVKGDGRTDKFKTFAKVSTVDDEVVAQLIESVDPAEWRKR